MFKDTIKVHFLDGTSKEFENCNFKGIVNGMGNHDSRNITFGSNNIIVPLNAIKYIELIK